MPLQGAIVVCCGDDQWGEGVVLCHCRWTGDDQLWGVDVVPLLGAIAGCHCSVPWLEGRVTANFEGRGAIAGAIVVCYGWGEGDDQLWGEWTWCHCWVGANFCFISSSYVQGHQFHPDTRENNNEFCLELLADVTLFSTLIT